MDARVLIDALKAWLALALLGIVIGGLVMLLAALIAFVPFAIDRDRTTLFGLSKETAMAAASVAAAMVWLGALSTLLWEAWKRLVDAPRADRPA